jgi:hypothetical protein
VRRRRLTLFPLARGEVWAVREGGRVPAGASAVDRWLACRGCFKWRRPQDVFAFDEPWFCNEAASDPSHAALEVDASSDDSDINGENNSQGRVHDHFDGITKKAWSFSAPFFRCSFSSEFDEPFKVRRGVFY